MSTRDSCRLRGLLRLGRFCVGIILTILAGCGSSPAPTPNATKPPPARLSEFALFAGNPAEQRPAEGVVPYDLNTPLFSDYAEKYRFLKLPPGASATYQTDAVFEFPIGTVIAKTFAYPSDAREPSKGRRLIETRILSREADGWIGLPYLWNEAQTDAVLELAGDTVDVAWVHTNGQRRTNNYIVPNTNQCKGCHQSDDMIRPIGPRASQLNRDFNYDHGAENQLSFWSRTGILTGAPAPTHAPRLPVWDDPQSGTLDDRARAWLEINCAHCHNPKGPARNSGLDLLTTQRNPVAFGVYKQPVAAGLGSGGLAFDIVPGRPSESILLFRIASTHPGVMMPELGKRLVHEEGVALIRDWIAAMPASATTRKQTSAPTAAH